MANAPSPDAHWRDSARTVRFFFFDYRAAFPLVFTILHFRAWTFWTAVITTVFFAMLERYGFTVVVFFRYLRSFVAGKRKMAKPWWQQSKAV